ncbi:hypothetical protein LCGC14_0321040 [marine sediment metagenome]|uniref:CdsD C-terminal domain-containing protein n=1 Tax=marine sediment metagenome TaxID=412755 RepID=A0A0F9U1X1_9ZZZZ|nr:hypothetical protein [Phycisphaerae bacterium]HDZ43130.1 hypothetical protein [Phycisphaerae bacterium]
MTDVPGNQDWVQRLKTELVRDKKKTITLTVLALVAVVMAARFLQTKGGPATARAETVAVVDSEVSDAEELALSVAKDLRIHESDEYIKHIDHTITRDLFAFNQDHFTPLPAAAVETTDEQTPAAAETTGPPPIDWQEVITRQSRDLVLQSTINSDIPIVVINGRVLGLGDVIDGFKVVRIDAGLCLLEKKSITITLKMPH